MSKEQVVAKYNMNQKSRLRNRVPRRLYILALVFFLLLGISVFFVRHVYYQDLRPVNNSQSTVIVTIKSGSSSKQIADQLASQHLIRSAWAFQLYVHSKELSDKLQAGTYAISSDQDMSAIITTLTQGDVTTKLVTILPGRRIDQVRAALINDGFSPDAVDRALQPSQYSDISTLAYKPAGASLEGLLFPDSFQKTAQTDPSVIIRESLTEMGEHLTPTIQADFAREGLTTYQGLIIASMVEQEVSKPSDRAQAAQVFIKRLQTGMMLGSDVTAYYGAIIAGQSPTTTYASSYNTLLHTGLPPTPIGTVSDSSLEAVANPATTDWLYFVSGDNGNTYFSTTLQQQQAYTAQYCHKLCSE
jgi:UPF0755 protein